MARDGLPHVLERPAVEAARRYLARLRANPRAGLVIDTEAAQCPDGQRPSKQVRAVGDAARTLDAGAVWTTGSGTSSSTAPQPETH
jgi:hypothetical protein